MGRVKGERVEKRRCSCGVETDFRVLSLERGEDVPLHMRTVHNAPCGRICFESAGVTTADVASGKAHHNRRCECLKVGRGYT